jgi:RND superfamily putative drug exporter
MAVFRAVLAPLLTLAPAVLVTQLAGPVIAEASKAGLQVSSLTQILLLILVIGAGTDYGLFLVFRVREELRAGLAPHDAVVRALARVGESVTFSAATVIAALLTLLLAVFGLFSALGVPLAIAIALMLAAGLTLMPALLAIFGRAAFWPSRITASAGRPGWWGRTASRIVARPAAVLALGLAVFGGLAVAAVGYTPTGFGATPPAPAGSDSAAGQALLAAHFPAASSNPTVILLRFPAPVWRDPGPAARAEQASPPARCSPPGRPAGGQQGHAGSRPAHRCTPGSATRALPAQPRPGAGVTAGPGPPTAQRASSSARTGGPSGWRPASRGDLIGRRAAPGPGHPRRDRRRGRAAVPPATASRGTPPSPTTSARSPAGPAAHRPVAIIVIGCCSRWCCAAGGPVYLIASVCSATWPRSASPC